MCWCADCFLKRKRLKSKAESKSRSHSFQQDLLHKPVIRRLPIKHTKREQKHLKKAISMTNMIFEGSNTINLEGLLGQNKTIYQQKVKLMETLRSKVIFFLFFEITWITNKFVKL